MFSLLFSGIIKSEIMRKLVCLYAMATSLLWCGKDATALFHKATVLKKVKDSATAVFTNFKKNI
jgi:hypothetical protein